MDKEFMKWLDEELETQRSDFEFLNQRPEKTTGALIAGGQVTALENAKEKLVEILWKEAIE